MSDGDRVEVERFAAFLRDAGPPPGAAGTDPDRRRRALCRHYPDDARAAGLDPEEVLADEAAPEHR